MVDVTKHADTEYYVEDANVLSVSTEGVITALKNGTTQVVVVRGGTSFETQFDVVVSQGLSSQTVGKEGGIVGTPDGPKLGIPADALDVDSVVSIAAVDQSELPYQLPVGFSFHSGFQIDGLPLQNEHPASLSLPAGDSLQAGDPLFIVAPIDVVIEGEPIESSWLLVDAMTVGEDGRVRTTSPPNVGIGGRTYSGGSSFRHTSAGIAFTVTPSLGSSLTAMSDLSTRLSTRGNPQFGDYITSMDSDVTGAGGGAQKFYGSHDILGTYFVPMVFSLPYKVTSFENQPTGLRKVGEQEIMVSPGELATIILPNLPRTESQDAPPSLVAGALRPPQSSGDPLQIQIRGSEFIALNPYRFAPEFDGSKLGSRVEDLYVTIEIGGRDTFDTDGKRLPIGGSDIRIDGRELTLEGQVLSFDVPAGVQVAGAAITVTRPMDLPLDGEFTRQELTSNPISILAEQKYAIAASVGGDQVIVYDVCGIRENGELGSSCKNLVPGEEGVKLEPFVRATIGLQDGESTARLAPRKTIASPDGTRFYVTLEGGGSVAVIDAVALQQIDTIPDDILADKSKGINAIPLPPGATPFDMDIDRVGRRLYVSDFSRGAIYVIDIDPFSPTYHQLKTTITIPDRADQFTGLGRIGLRGIAVDKTGSRLFVASPRVDVTRGSGIGNGAVVSIILRDEDGKLIDVPVVNNNDPLAVTEVGPTPYEISITDDPDVILVTDRLADSQGLSVLRVDVSGRFEVDPISFVDYGAIPRLTEGRGTQVHGVSNAQSVSFVAEDQFIETIGPHPSYAVVSGSRRFKVGDSKTDPNLGPFFVYNAYLDDPETGIDEKFLISAGGNIGLIRNPLGDFDDLVDKPRLVAATTPIQQGFTDDVAVATQSGLVLAAHSGADLVTGHDLTAMILAIEALAKADHVASWSQLPEDPAADGELSALLRGPLSTVPIDLAFKPTAVAADFRFFVDDGNLNYGVPPVGLDGSTPNNYAPLSGGDLPRGLSVQPAMSGDILSLAPTPYNQTPSMLGFPSQPLSVEVGVKATAEVHSGALTEQHRLVSYRSVEQERGIVLHYDSLRADPRPIYHVNVANLHEQNYDIATDRFGYRLTAIDNNGVRYHADGIDQERADETGLEIGTNLYRLPDTGQGTSTRSDSATLVALAGTQSRSSYGAGLQIDLSEAETGLYTMEVEYGLLRGNGDKFNGRMTTQTFVFAHVNATESIFGAGWGQEGYLRMYPGDAGVLLVDGNGLEQIFLAPEEDGQPFTPVVNDYSLVTVSDQGFRRRLRDGTVQEFDVKGLLKSSTNRNVHKTQFIHIGEKLSEIIDPVGLTTSFQYAGDRVARIIDPANRTTGFTYDSKGNLIGIVDPDLAERTFQYQYEHASDSELGQHLLTGQTFPRGNDPLDPLGAEFTESYVYDSIDGRLRSSTRVDAKTSALVPAQVSFLNSLEDTSDPEKAPVLHELSSPSTVSQSSMLVHSCGGTPPPTSSTLYTASGSYDDFRGKSHLYAMTGYGQYETTMEGRRKQNQFGRGEDGGRILAELDGEDNLVCYTRDSFGNITEQKDFPDGTPAIQTTSYDYLPAFGYAESFNIPVKIVDPVGRTTEHKLDERGNIVETKISDANAPAGSPSEVFQVFEYTTELFLPDITKDGRGNIIDADYDGFGRLIRQSFSDGARTYVYDDLTGFVSEEVDANGNRTIYTRDAMNRVTSTSYVGDDDTPTFTSTTDYDAHGNKVEESDRDQIRTTYSFDILDRPSSMVSDAESLAYETRYAYEFGTLDPDYAVSGAGGDIYITEHPTGFFTVSVYNEFNELVGTYDELGRRTTYELDEAGRVEAVIPVHEMPIYRTLDERGRTKVESGPLPDVTTTFEYDDADRVTQSTVANTSGAQVTQYIYNLFDSVAFQTDAENNVTRMDYDESGNPVAEYLGFDTEEQIIVSRTFDARNRVETEAIGTAKPALFTYYPEGQIKVATNPLDYTSEYFLDTMNRTTRIVDAEDGVSTNQFSGEGNLLFYTDARGEEFATTYEYDGRRRLIAQSNPKGETVRYAYDEADRMIAAADPRAVSGVDSSRFVQRSEYDAAGRLQATIDGEGNRVEYDYDDLWDTITAVRVPAPNLGGTGTVETTQRWSDDRRVLTVRTPTDSEPLERRITYDTLGNEIRSEFVGTNVVTETRFDRLNRPFESTEAPNTSDAATRRTRYNAVGKVIAQIDPLGIETRYQFDGKLDLESTFQAFGTTAQFVVETVFDDVGNLRSISDPRVEGLATTYEYDGLDRRKVVNSPFGGIGGSDISTVTYEYDPIGNVMSQTDPRNPLWKTTFEYDAAGQLEKQTDAKSEEWFFEYDEAGNLTKQTDPQNNTWTMQFDANNRPIGRIDPLSHASCTVYDAAGNVAAVVGANAGLTTCEFLAGADLAGSTHTTIFEYDDANRRVRTIDAEGFVESVSYDAAARVSQINDPRTITLGGDYSTKFEYDGRGNVIKQTSSAGLDGDDEVLVELNFYDLNDNLLKNVDPRNIETGYAYDQLNRIIEIDRQVSIPELDIFQPNEITAYRYDELGNVTEMLDPRGSHFNTFYEYNAAGLLESITQKNRYS